MNKKYGISKEEAFNEACKRNGLNYRKHGTGKKSDQISFVDDKGQEFVLNNDLSIDKNKSNNKNNELAATIDLLHKGINELKNMNIRTLSLAANSSVHEAAEDISIRAPKEPLRMIKKGRRQKQRENLISDNDIQKGIQKA